MSRLSQRQAAAEWGVARVTLQRAIKDGKVSKDYEGKVDTSELLRVFGEPKGPALGRPTEPEKTTDFHAKMVDLATQNGRLQAENEGLRKVLVAKDETIKAQADALLRLAPPTPATAADGIRPGLVAVWTVVGLALIAAIVLAARLL